MFGVGQHCYLARAGCRLKPGAIRTVSVRLDGVTLEFACASEETILSAAQKAGLEPPFSCADGFCGSCMARVTAGSIEMINNDYLSRVECAEGWVLTCQALPRSDKCAIEYPD